MDYIMRKYNNGKCIAIDKKGKFGNSSYHHLLGNPPNLQADDLLIDVLQKKINPSS